MIGTATFGCLRTLIFLCIFYNLLAAPSESLFTNMAGSMNNMMNMFTPLYAALNKTPSNLLFKLSSEILPGLLNKK